jgi:hypothetical protein
MWDQFFRIILKPAVVYNFTSTKDLFQFDSVPKIFSRYGTPVLGTPWKFFIFSGDQLTNVTEQSVMEGLLEVKRGGIKPNE